MYYFEQLVCLGIIFDVFFEVFVLRILIGVIFALWDGWDGGDGGVIVMC